MTRSDTSAINPCSSTLVSLTVDTDETTTLLNTISSYFSVKPTKYGGRGCFANCDLIEGTIIHECSLPLSSTIARPFKKEVCGFCFTVLQGKTVKFKLTLPKDQQPNFTSDPSLALYFCSQACMDKFMASDVDSLYLESLLNVESLFNKILSTQRQYDLESMQEEEKAETEAILQLDNELKQTKDIELFISQKWQEAEINCQLILSKLKPKQRKNFDNLRRLIPKINENEYLEIKYIIGVLFQMYKQENTSSSSLELHIFSFLQPNDVEKILKYPYLLHSYMKIYQFLRISTLEKLQPYITPSGVRAIIGKRLTNNFGIWSTEEQGGDKEFFGLALYPSASFFNHSCHPNVMDNRVGSTLTFKLLKNVQENEELLISYVPHDSDDFELRQKELKEWFFDCSCQRCIEEKNVKK